MPLIPKNHEPRELGAIIGLFLIMIGLLSPALWVWRLARGFANAPGLQLLLGDAWVWLQVAEWVLTSLCIIGIWVICFRLLYVYRWSSVRLAIWGIWVINLGGFLVEAAILLAFTGQPLELFLNNGGTSQLVRPFLFNLVWTAYLLRSRHVASLYAHSPEEQAEVFE